MRVKFITILIPAAILIMGGIIGYILLGFREEPQRRKPTPRPRIVRAETVELKDTPVTLEGFGKLASVQPVVLSSEVNGVLVSGEKAFLPGQNFKKGDLLLKVDDRQAKLDLNSAKSDFMSALATVLPEIKIDFPDKYETWANYFNGVEFDRNIQPLPEVKNTKNQTVPLALQCV